MKRQALFTLLVLGFTLIAVLGIGAEKALAEPAPGTQVHLPTLNYLAGEEACDVLIQAQNVGDDFTKAMILFWGETSNCPPDCSGPLDVECSGLLAPGSTWYFLGGPFSGRQVPDGARSATVFSLSIEQQDGDTIADAICEAASSSVRGDCDEYRRFKKAFDEGLAWHGFDFGVDARGEPLAVDVSRHCQTSTMAASVEGAYSGVTSKTLGWETSDEYTYYAPLVNGDAQGTNSILSIQNAGLECTSVELRFRAEQDDCPGTTATDTIPSVGPGETVHYDVSSLVDPGFTGNARIQSSELLAITSDTVSGDFLTSQKAVPGDGLSAGQTAGDRVLHAPLTYSSDEG